MSRIPLLSAVLITVAVSALAGSAEETNKALVQRFYDEIFNKGNTGQINELIAENFVEHEPFPGLGADRDGLVQFVSMIRAAFPDLRFDVHFMIAEGDRVAVFLTMSGTQKGDFMGMPASGKKVSVNTIDIIRIADGKGVEHWGVTDGLTMMQQLGAVPPPAAGE